jgi:hypothetical protein
MGFEILFCFDLTRYEVKFTFWQAKTLNYLFMMMEIGSFCQMKPNFSQMSKADLRAYVLQHREDDEALRALMSRRDPNAIRYNFPSTEEGLRQTEEVIRRKIEGTL